MNVLVGLLASLAVVQAAPHIGHYTYPAATTLVRVPHEDSAIVHSSRFGPNFSYSIAQQHAYQLVPPNVAIYVKSTQFFFNFFLFISFNTYISRTNIHSFIRIKILMPDGTLLRPDLRFTFIIQLFRTMCLFFIQIQTNSRRNIRM